MMRWARQLWARWQYRRFRKAWNRAAKRATSTASNEEIERATVIDAETRDYLHKIIGNERSD
jgi:hypothetical protein